MNEAETRAEYIDPKLKESGWYHAIGGGKPDFLVEMRFFHDRLIKMPRFWAENT